MGKGVFGVGRDVERDEGGIGTGRYVRERFEGRRN